MAKCFLGLALKTTAIYLLFASLWILLSDHFLLWLSDDPTVLTHLQTYKGIFFILVSGGLLMVLQRRDLSVAAAAGDRLQESEARYRLLFEQNPLPMYVYDLETLRFLAVNPAAVAHYGYRREEFLDLTLRDIRPAEDLTRLETTLASLGQGPERTGVWRHRKKDGSLIEVEVVTHALEFEGRQAILALAHDVTERRRRERQLEAIAEMSAALRDVTVATEMYPAILGATRRLLSAEAAALIVPQKDGHPCRVVLGSGVWAETTGLAFNCDQAPLSSVLEKHRPCLNENPSGHGCFERPDLHLGLSSVSCFPLAVRDQTIGILAVGLSRTLGEAEQPVLAAGADIAANALNRAFLHDQTQRQLRQLATLHNIDLAIIGGRGQELTLNLLLGQIHSQLQVDAAAILVLPPPKTHLYCVASQGFRTPPDDRARSLEETGLPGQAVREKRLVTALDLQAACREEDFFRCELLAGEEFVSYLAHPLVSRGEVHGVLELFHRGPLRPDREWLTFFEALAVQIAIAIENLRLFQDLERSNQQLRAAYDKTIEGWSRALDLRDKETEGHSLRVTEQTVRLAEALGIVGDDLVQVRRGALLHDIGKMGIPDHILLKPGKLTAEEWETMRCHPRFAHQLLAPIMHLKKALDIPYCHHEKWDGSGYPRNLRGEEIPLAARIFAVVDVWDALTSDRPYRRAWPRDKARAYIRDEAGRHFDPQVVEKFLELDF